MRQISNFSLIALSVGLALSGCTTTGTGEAPLPSAGQRDLTPEEKQVIMDAVAPALRNPGSAKYHWASFPAVVTEDSVNYCARQAASSPAPNSGHPALALIHSFNESRIVSGARALFTRLRARMRAAVATTGAR